MRTSPKLMACASGPAGVVATTVLRDEVRVLVDEAVERRRDTRPSVNLAPTSKLLPVSGFTLMFGAMLPAVAGPGKQQLLEVRMTVAAAEADERVDARRRDWRRCRCRR